MNNDDVVKKEVRGDVAEMACIVGETYTLRPTPHTLHFTRYTLHLHPTPYTPHSHFARYTLHPTPYTINPQPSTLNPQLRGDVAEMACIVGETYSLHPKPSALKH